MPIPSTDLSDLAGQFFKTSSNADLSDIGPASREIRDTVTRSEERTRPFVATVFWQAFIFTPSFVSFMEYVKSMHTDFRVKLLQVVPHSVPASSAARFDLLVLADGLFDHDDYIYGDASSLPSELLRGSELFLSELRSARKGSETVLDKIHHADVALEAVLAQPFGILVLPAPSMAPIASVAFPAAQITEPAQGKSSTAGVRCANAQGKSGVTAAWHAVQDSVQGVVDVEGHSGSVISSDLLSDSAFIEVSLPPSPAATPAPVLSNLVPRQHEPVVFAGAASGQRNGKVTGWSPQLPAVTGYSQLVVTTNPISAPGDSGAALRDGQGNLLGFCHETSAFGAVNPYSSWIWAESVFKAHDLH